MNNNNKSSEEFTFKWERPRSEIYFAYKRELNDKCLSSLCTLLFGHIRFTIDTENISHSKVKIYFTS